MFYRLSYLGLCRFKIKYNLFQKSVCLAKVQSFKLNCSKFLISIIAFGIFYSRLNERLRAAVFDSMDALSAKWPIVKIRIFNAVEE